MTATRFNADYEENSAMKNMLIDSKKGILKSLISISFLIVTVCATWGLNAFAEPVVLKMSVFEPPQSYFNQHVFAPLIEQINKAGEGIVKIDIFAGGTLGRSPLQQLKLVNDGVADIAMIVNAYHPGQLVDDQVINTPFTAKTSMDCTPVFNDMREKGLLRGYDDLVVIGQICHAQYAIHTTFPVRVPSDLKGKKIRTAGKMHHALTLAVGATPIAMGVDKVAENTSRGVVDGTFSNWGAMKTFRINDVTPYHCKVPIGSTSLMLVMSKARYEKLPAKVKSVLDPFIGDRTSMFWAIGADSESDYVENIARNTPKHEIYTPNAEEMKQWKAAFKPVIDSWNKENDRWEMLLKNFEEGLKLTQE